MSMILFFLFHRSKRNLIEIAHVDGLICIGLDDKIPTLTRPFLTEVLVKYAQTAFIGWISHDGQQPGIRIDGHQDVVPGIRIQAQIPMKIFSAQELLTLNKVCLGRLAIVNSKLPECIRLPLSRIKYKFRICVGVLQFEL